MHGTSNTVHSPSQTLKLMELKTEVNRRTDTIQAFSDPLIWHGLQGPAQPMQSLQLDGRDARAGQNCSHVAHDEAPASVVRTAGRFIGAATDIRRRCDAFFSILIKKMIM